MSSYLRLQSQQIKSTLLFVFSFALFLVLPEKQAQAGVFDDIIANLGTSVEGIPYVIAVVSYIAGIAFAITAILKLKAHVDNPNQESLRSVLGRLAFGGMLLALPTVLDAMVSSIGERLASGAPPVAPDGAASFDGIGGLIMNVGNAFSAPSVLFSVISYLFGVAFAAWSLFEFIKTSDNPSQSPIRRPIMIMLTGAALLALPTVVAALRSITESIASFQYAGGGLSGGEGGSAALDQILVNLVTNIHGPLITLISYVAYIAGLSFATIGVFRLMKSAQDGPKAPWGMGTIGTFLTAAALLSLNKAMGASQVSIFADHMVSTYAVLADSQNMDAELATRANQAIQAVLMFVQIVGWFSFVRGLFIFRAFGEGDGQASLSSGFTHVIGGAIAVNLSAFINAVQSTLGLFGLAF